METSKTQSRALELALLDLHTHAKPTDQEIAERWGCADARSVREVRASEAYAVVKAELTDYAASYAVEQVGEVVSRAAEGLAAHLPAYVERLSELLRRPPAASPDWVIPDRRMAAATSALNFLLKLADLGRGRPESEAGPPQGVTMPSLVQAESRLENVRRYRELSITVREVGEPEPPAQEWDLDA